MGITTKDPGIYDYITAALTEECLRKYIGIDINEDLLKQAEEYYGKNPKMRFIKGNINDGLPDPIISEEPFDLYFTSYGTLSHFHDEQNVKLIADICRHAPPNAPTITLNKDRFMALHIKKVKIVPAAPTSIPPIIMAILW